MLLLWPRIFCWPWCHTYANSGGHHRNLLESVACWPTPLHALHAIHVRCRTTGNWWHWQTSVAMPQVPCQEEHKNRLVFLSQSLNQLILFIYLWSEDIPLELIQRQTSIQDDGTYGHGLGKHDRGGVQPRPNGQLLWTGGFDNNGQARIVNIDESKFFPRKYHRGL